MQHLIERAVQRVEGYCPPSSFQAERRGRDECGVERQVMRRGLLWAEDERQQDACRRDTQREGKRRRRGVS